MNTTTLAIKARLANHIRKTLYKKKWENMSPGEIETIFDEIFKLNHQMHWELNEYKAKRKAKRELRKKREAAPQTKSMIKKLGRKAKKNLENTK